MAVESTKTLSSEELEGKKIISSIAMTILLVSFSMLFATLLLGYTAFRFTNAVWPPMGMERVDLFLPTVSTFIVLMSSFAYFKFEKSFNDAKTTDAKMWFLVTLIAGVSFVFTQFVLWETLKKSGFYVTEGVFPSLIFGLTWTHAAHMVLGLMSLLYLVRILRKKEWIQFSANVNNVGKFWHFLGVVWVVMYLVMFAF